MCTQINNLFTCGHRSFKRFDNCPRFGQSCFGAGSNHKDHAATAVCKDCRFREEALQRHGSSTAASTPDGGTPDSSASGGSASDGRKDPWWDGDPWRRYRKG